MQLGIAPQPQCNADVAEHEMLLGQQLAQRPQPLQFRRAVEAVTAG